MTEKKLELLNFGVKKNSARSFGYKEIEVLDVT